MESRIIYDTPEEEPHLRLFGKYLIIKCLARPRKIFVVKNSYQFYYELTYRNYGCVLLYKNYIVLDSSYPLYKYIIYLLDEQYHLEIPRPGFQLSHFNPLFNIETHEYQEFIISLYDFRKGEFNEKGLLFIADMKL
jgi:hypothetical protein